MYISVGFCSRKLEGNVRYGSICWSRVVGLVVRNGGYIALQ